MPEANTPIGSLTGAPGNIGGPLGRPFCKNSQPYLLQVKALGSYTIPNIDVQVGATFQSVPGPQLHGELHGAGRAGVGGAANARPSAVGRRQHDHVNLVSPGTLYGDRLYQTDFRVGKIFRFSGNRRLTASVDLFNLFNGNAVLDAVEHLLDHEHAVLGDADDGAAAAAPQVHGHAELLRPGTLVVRR